MKFGDWCLKDDNDDRLMLVLTTKGDVYRPGEPVALEVVNHLKRLQLLSAPKIVDGKWVVVLIED